ncbi:MAG: hypothetical protein IKW46_07760 [Bacteroidaceae bacterium]|nr:hypothetical protein [Bacteroidaceae bacterium]
MKKSYVSPFVEIVEISTMYMLALSRDDEQVDDEEQMSNELRGGWSDIWSGM